MKYKVILGILIFVLFILSFLIYVRVSFSINGSSNIELYYLEDYEDKGASFNLFFKSFNNLIKVDNNVDTSKVGEYEVVYKIKIGFYNMKRVRKVKVVDVFSPVIVFKSDDLEKTVCPNGDLEEDYKAYDLYDGDLTDKVKLTDDEDGLIYSVTDSSNNKYSVKRKIKREDTEAPSLKLKGPSTIYLGLTMKYEELGYEVKDNCDSDIKVTVESNVDTNKAGNYTITYKAVDSSLNETIVKRNVIVYKESGNGLIYLTFDDGPSGSGSTLKILNILKEEGVKATFFVTCSGPDNLIKREYDEGHTVALHTKSHKYSYVYSSSDNYFDDLYAVQNRVYNITGVKSTIIRFPGGSNNTVSNKYSPGIMSTLKQQVLEKGFTYFDWNISSGDAGGCTTSSCVYNTVVKSLSKSRPNMVLMHDIKMFTADAIRDIIRYGKANGYTFAPITLDTKPIHFG